MGKFIDSFVSSALTSIISVAATTPGAGLRKLSGKVMIDQGNSFASAAAVMNLEVGDRLFIGKDSMTTVNCGARKIRASKANVYTVVTQAPCAAGEKTAYLAEDHAFELNA